MTMTMDDKKQLIRKHFDAMNQGDWPKAIDYLAENGRYWTAGSFGGWKNKSGMQEIFHHQMPVFFPKGLQITADRMVAEGDWVAVEAHSYAPVTMAGKVYQQHYHFLYEVRDGKLQTVKEYLDTQHVLEALLGQ